MTLASTHVLLYPTIQLWFCIVSVLVATLLQPAVHIQHSSVYIIFELLVMDMCTVLLC